MSTTSFPPIRIHQPDPICELDETASRNIPGFQALDDAFQHATGWSLSYSESGVSRQRRIRTNCLHLPIHGSLRISDLSDQLPPGVSASSRERCDELVARLNNVLRALDESREQNWLLQADLAANVPATLPLGDRRDLAMALGQLLQAAARRWGANAALLYLLDDQGETLSLRSSCGWSVDQFDQRRRLEESPVDVRALTGQTVRLCNALEYQDWNLPAACRSASCTPILGPQKSIGTLWLLSDEQDGIPGAVADGSCLIPQQVSLLLERATLRRELEHIRKSKGKDPTLTSQDQMPQQLRFDQLAVTSISSDSAFARSTGSWRVDSQGEVTAAQMSAGNSTSDPQTQRLVCDACFQSLAMTTASVCDLVSGFLEVAGRATSGNRDVAIVACSLDPLTGRTNLARSGMSSAWVLRDGGIREMRLDSDRPEPVVGDFGRREHLFLTTMPVAPSRLAACINQATKKGSGLLSHEQWVNKLRDAQTADSGRKEPLHGLLISRL